MEYTKKLADFCTSLEYKEIPPEIISKAKQCLLDWIGIVLRASIHPQGIKIGGFVKKIRSIKCSTLLGFDFKASPMDAAFVNGTLTEILELQDGTAIGGGHPSSSVIPAAVAIAEKEGSNGRDLITSIVVGYEAMIRVGRAMHPSHLWRGFLATGTVGTIGSAVAVGKLLKFDSKLMENAIGIAGFLTPVCTGDNLWGGYTCKPIHGGQAAKTGIECAWLAEIGFTGCPLEGGPRKKGFCNILSDNPNLESMVEELGRKYMLNYHYFKPYACCRIAHPSVEGALNLVQKYDLKPEDIIKVNIRTYDFAASTLGQAYTNIMSGFNYCQFSIPYAVAVAVIDRHVNPEQFSEQRVNDFNLHEFAKKVTVIEDSSLNLFPEKRPAIIEIETKTNKFSCRVDYPKGDYRNPLSEEELIEKFKVNSKFVLDVKKIEKLIVMIREIESIENISKIFRLTQKRHKS